MSCLAPEELQASCERDSISLCLIENASVTGARTKLQRQLAERCWLELCLGDLVDVTFGPLAQISTSVAM